MRSNACIIDISLYLGASLTFNVLGLYIPRELFEPSPFCVNDPNLDCPLALFPLLNEEVEYILDEQTFYNEGGELQWFLIYWRGTPSFDDSWRIDGELNLLDPTLMECYWSKFITILDEVEFFWELKWIRVMH